MPEWKDATTYSQGERGKKEPSSWETVIAGVRVWVSKAHIGYPETWVVTCREIDVVTKAIANAEDLTPEEARGEALETVAHAAYQKAKKLQAFVRDCRE